MTNHRATFLADVFLAFCIGLILAWTLFTNL